MTGVNREEGTGEGQTTRGGIVPEGYGHSFQNRYESAASVQAGSMVSYSVMDVPYPEALLGVHSMCLWFYDYLY